MAKVNNKSTSEEAVSQSTQNVIPGGFAGSGRYPWFDRLTTLSEVERESRQKKIRPTTSRSRLASRFAGLGRDNTASREVASVHPKGVCLCRGIEKAFGRNGVVSNQE